MTKKKMSSSSAKAKAKAPGSAPKRPAASAKPRTKPAKAAKPATRAKPAKAPKMAPAKTPATAGKRTGKPQPSAPPPSAAPKRPGPPPPPPRRSTYADAVATYDKGMQAFHARRFAEAQLVLSSIVTLYPEEKELHERVQMYLNVCARHVGPQEARPQTVEERVNSATLAINDGRTDEAIAILKPVAADDASNDSAAYLLGVAYTLKQDFPSAMTYLERAVRLNPENRDLIRKEADLESLRQTDQFESLLNTPVSVPRKRKT
jgi:tetratricopeptide (TPR) repeat protein